MKAAVSTRYGPPDVVQIKEVEKPVPRDDEVLIAVRAASVNPLDGGILRGKVVLTVRGPNHCSEQVEQVVDETSTMT